MQKNNVIKFGTNTSSKKRYKCKNKHSDKNTFLLEYSRNGDLPEIKQKIIDMASKSGHLYWYQIVLRFKIYG